MNKYQSLYNKIVEMYREYDGIGETHHIVPKSLGGSNDKENLVKVPARVHFILHRLLPKFTNGKDKAKMIFALWRMCNPQSKYHTRDFIVSSKVYESIRLYHSNLMKTNNPMFDESVVTKRTGIKRPDQSAVATKRNIEYWKDKKLPIIKIECEHCNNEFETNNSTRRFCSKSCRMKWQNHIMKQKKTD